MAATKERGTNGTQPGVIQNKGRKKRQGSKTPVARTPRVSTCHPVCLLDRHVVPWVVVAEYEMHNIPDSRRGLPPPLRLPDPGTHPSIVRRPTHTRKRRLAAHPHLSRLGERHERHVLRRAALRRPDGLGQVDDDQVDGPVVGGTREPVPRGVDNDALDL